VRQAGAGPHAGAWVAYGTADRGGPWEEGVTDSNQGGAEIDGKWASRRSAMLSLTPGALLNLERMDGEGPTTPEVARGKARTAAAHDHWMNSPSSGQHTATIPL
jgi:hypothetical protein